MASGNFPIKRTNEKKTVIYEYDKAQLRVGYFWNNHGELIDWNWYVEEPRFWSDAKVRVIEYAFTMKLRDEDCDFKVYQLEVNGKIISGSCTNIQVVDEEGKVIIDCQVVVGWG